MSPSPLAQLDQQTAELLSTIDALTSLDALRDAEATLIGKRSVLASLQKSLGSLEPEDRRAAGAELQEARRRLHCRRNGAGGPMPARIRNAGE